MDILCKKHTKKLFRKISVSILLIITIVLSFISHLYTMVWCSHLICPLPLMDRLHAFGINEHIVMFIGVLCFLGCPIFILWIRDYQHVIHPYNENSVLVGIFLYYLSSLVLLLPLVFMEDSTPNVFYVVCVLGAIVSILGIILFTFPRDISQFFHQKYQ